ncbi:class I SAM-dependent methyltransferase [Chloroflexota bacterium]
MQSHTDYNAWLIREKSKFLSYIPVEVSSVLDVGCGRGELLCLLKEKGFEVEGCDMDDVLIEKSAHFAQIKRADATKLSQIYPENSFDLVTCLHTLEHTLHSYNTLQELRKVSRKYILISVPNARYIAHNERKTHLYSWNGDTLKNLIEKSGLTLLKLQQDRTNMFPNIIRLTPIVNKIILKLFTGPNELVALCIK